MRRGSTVALIVLACAGRALAEPIVLVDRAAQAHVDGFTAHGSTWYGAGVAFVDLDGDTWPDLWLGGAAGQVDALCLNRRDGTFACGDAPGAPVNAADVLGLAAADFDGDGDLDVYVMRETGNSLLRNDGSAHFTDVSEATGTGGDLSRPHTPTGTFLDFDGDGRLDLFVGHWAPLGKVTPQSRAQLLQQQADGTFADMSAPAGMSNQDRPMLAMLAVDWNKDGRQDLFLTADFHPTLFLRNDGGRFADVTATQTDDVVASVTEGMGIDAGDLDGDGWPDLYATGNQVLIDGSYQPGKLGSALLFNRGDGTFESRAVELGVNTGFAWGTGIIDLDGDGLLDVFVATDMADHHSIYRNLGARRFVEQPLPGIALGRNQCVTAAFADYDRDGRVDVVLHRIDGHAPQLFHNETANENHHLQILLATGHDELGARVSVRTAAGTQERELLSQTSHGATNDRRFTFGLGGATSADVLVRFPDGALLELDGVAADQSLVLDRNGLTTEQPVHPPAYAGCAAAGRPPTDGAPLLALALIGLLVRRGQRTWWQAPPSGVQHTPKSR